MRKMLVVMLVLFAAEVGKAEMGTWYCNASGGVEITSVFEVPARVLALEAESSGNLTDHVVMAIGLKNVTGVDDHLRYFRIESRNTQPGLFASMKIYSETGSAPASPSDFDSGSDTQVGPTVDLSTAEFWDPNEVEDPPPTAPAEFDFTSLPAGGVVIPGNGGTLYLYVVIEFRASVLGDLSLLNAGVAVALNGNLPSIEITTAGNGPVDVDGPTGAPATVENSPLYVHRLETRSPMYDFATPSDYFPNPIYMGKWDIESRAEAGTDVHSDLVVMGLWFDNAHGGIQDQITNVRLRSRIGDDWAARAVWVYKESDCVVPTDGLSFSRTDDIAWYADLAPGTFSWNKNEVPGPDAGMSITMAWVANPGVGMIPAGDLVYLYVVVDLDPVVIAADQEARERYNGVEVGVALNNATPGVLTPEAITMQSGMKGPRELIGDNAALVHNEMSPPDDIYNWDSGYPEESGGQPWILDLLGLAKDTSLSTHMDTPIVVDYLPTYEPDGGPTWTFAILSGPSNGSISGLAPATGAFTYTPDTGFNGSDSLEFTVCDNGVPVMCDTGVVRITVQGQWFCFEAAVDLAVGPFPTCAIASDLDADGDADLVVADYNTDSVSVLKNNGYGTFAGAVQYFAGSYPIAVAAADFDGDGHTDLVTANNPTDDVSILRNNGDGTFSAPTRYAADDAPVSVITADLDGDGYADVVATNAGGDDVSVLMNNGDGTFASAVHYAVVNYAASVFATDLEGDGDQDLIVANYYSGSISILENSGDGTFTLLINYPVGDHPHSVVGEDLDGDGDQDLAVANYLSDNVSVLKNNGDGTFAAAVNYPAGRGPLSIQTADFDRDGKFDLVAADYFSDSVWLLKNSGSGSFVEAASYAVGSVPYTVFVSDLDGNNYADLVVANSGSNDVSILLDCLPSTNQPPIARDTSLSTYEDTPIAVAYLPASDPDPGQQLAFTILSGPFNGIVSAFNSATGAFTYTPNPGYTGSDSLEFTVCDDGVPLMCDTCSFNITVSSLPLTRSRLDFYCPEGGPAPPPETLFVDGAEGEPWSLQKGGHWMGVSKSSGTIPDTIEVTADPTNLPARIYHGSVAFSTGGARGPAQFVDVSLHVNPAVEVGSKVTPAGASDSIPIYLSHDSISGLYMPLSYANSTSLTADVQTTGFRVDSMHITPYYLDFGMTYEIDTINQTIIVQRVPIRNEPVPRPDTADVALVGIVYYTTYPLAAGTVVTIDTISISCPDWKTASDSTCSVFYELPDGSIVIPDFEPGVIVISSLDQVESQSILWSDSRSVRFVCDSLPPETFPVTIQQIGGSQLPFTIAPSSIFTVEPSSGVTPMDVWVTQTGCPRTETEVMTVNSEMSTLPLEIPVQLVYYDAVVEYADTMSVPNTFLLTQNYPNPFNGVTIMEYAVPGRTQIDLAVYNVLGQRVETLASGVRPAGRYRVTWEARTKDGQELASGLYIVRMVAGDFVQTRKLMLMK